MSLTTDKVINKIRTGDFRFILSYVHNLGVRGCYELFIKVFKESMTILDYDLELRDEISRCDVKYPNSKLKRSLHVAFWKLRSKFKIVGDFGWNEKLHFQDDVINILVTPNGGLGDYVVVANYVAALKRKYKQAIRIDVLSKENFLKATQSVFGYGHNGVVEEVFPNDYSVCTIFYDACIEISRYPVFMNINKEKISRTFPEFIEYYDLCEKFRSEHRDIIDKRPFFDGDAACLCIKEHIKRIVQADVYGFLNMSEENGYPVSLCDPCETLTKFGLFGKKFITLHRGCDTDLSKDSVKLWPVDHYNALIEMIRERYPGYVIVQLGVSHKRCDSFDNVDLNLIGKTTLEDVKVLLDNSAVHIDGEGGMVHIRHAVCAKPSIVFFGPTPKEFYAYSENYNLFSGSCDQWCEWKSPTWMLKCVRGFDNPPCLSAITPDKTMGAVSAVLDQLDITSS